ncbi:hypothetical protein [Salinisphaera japonica]|uniref:Fe2OG dioxygenase domain-containing protein n=1 Tax=Salinisphaera japonica YTM-1 TaxID=1209778 RepID=A0A423PJ37_9GAMM|nr:hypothetical protein [Salinisphaera japonica]ROO25608.1 hypothetical protein SAJA_12505 [Salinisphaera japonica YTM-1]
MRNYPASPDVQLPRKDILGYESAWNISPFGLAQFEHNYDPDLLLKIEKKALALKETHAIHKHLDLTFITGADRFIPEIGELIRDSDRLRYLSEVIGTPVEPYPFSVVSSTVTFMGPTDGSVSWHGDGVPVTELIPLSLSDDLQGGHLQVYRGNPDEGRAFLNSGATLDPEKIEPFQHRLGYSTVGQFLGVLHRTAPITQGTRTTLVLNLRSRVMPWVDDNRLFYLAADNDHDQSNWVDEIRADVYDNQLPAYRAFEERSTKREKDLAHGS